MRKFVVPASIASLGFLLAACTNQPPSAETQAQIDQQCQKAHCYCHDDTMSAMNPDRIKPVQTKPDGTRYCPTGQRLAVNSVQDGNMFLVPHLAGGR